MTVPNRRVICVGNELCTDDGVALKVARALELREDLPKDVELVQIAELGLSCLDAFLGVSQVIVVDAVALGGRPGTCSVLERPELLPRATCSVGHATSLTSLLELVAQVATKAPPKVTVIGIEAESFTPFCTTLSRAVSDAIPAAVSLVLSVLQAKPVQD